MVAAVLASAGAQGDAAAVVRPIAGAVVLWALVLSVPLLVGLRRIAARFRRRGRREGVLVIGGGLLAHQVVSAIEARPDVRLHVIGVVDESPAPLRGRYLGTVEHLREIVEQTRPDRVIVALGSRRGRMPCGRSSTSAPGDSSRTAWRSTRGSPARSRSRR